MQENEVPLSDAGPLPCPFCGVEPTTFDRPDGKGVYCSSTPKECGPLPLVVGSDLSVEIRKWNRRASSASAGTLTLEDRQFLHWLSERLTFVYGESPNVDYVLKLKKLAALADKEKEGKL